MKSLFTTLLLLIYFVAAANNIETWSKILNNKKTTSLEKVNAADKLLVYYRTINPDSAFFFTRVMIIHAKKINDTGTIDYGYTHLGSLHRIKGNLDSALYFYHLALKSYKARNFEDGIAAIYTNLATVYKTQNRFDLAIKNYNEALAIFKNTKRYNATGNLYSSFAELYFRLENYDKAVEYWQTAGVYFQKDSSEQLSHIYRGLTRVFIEKKKFKEANKEIKRALSIDKANKIDVFIVEDFVLMMQLALINDNVEEFLTIKREAQPIIHQIDIPLNKAMYFELNGEYHQRIKQPLEAMLYFDSALNIVRKENINDIELRILKKKFQIKLKETTIHSLQEEFITIQELEKTVALQRKERITQETDARYNLKDKEEKIKILDEKNKVANDLVQTERELKSQSQQQILWMWIGIGMFVILIIYILFTNKKLQTSQKELRKNIEEKEFLFKELNHRVKNNLHIVGSFLSIESFGKTEEVKEILLTCENRIQSLGLVHEMLYKGEIGEEINLKPYLEKLTEVIRQTLIQENTVLQTRIPNEVSLKSDKAVLLGLIANELITNAIKYAKIPDQKLIIELILKKEQQNFELIIRDNGKGFDESTATKNSMGLKLARGLSGQLNGKLAVSNSNGAEFILSFTI